MHILWRQEAVFHGGGGVNNGDGYGCVEAGYISVPSSQLIVLWTKTVLEKKTVF